MATPGRQIDHQPDKILDIKDLNEVISALERSDFPADRWSDLGLRLHIIQPKLDTVKANNPLNVKGCLKECLSLWLQQDYDVDTHGKPTLEKLAAAIKEMGLRAMADKIASGKIEALIDEVRVPISKLEVQIPVPKLLLQYFSSIRMSFESMMYEVSRAIIDKQNRPLDEIKKFLLYCSRYSLKAKLDDCSDISSVFYVIKGECSLTDIKLLQAVVKNLRVTEAMEYIEQYKTKLEEFCHSLSITLRLKERFDSISHLQCETVTFVFDWKPEEHVLEDIKDILTKITDGKLIKIEYIERSN